MYNQDENQLINVVFQTISVRRTLKEKKKVMANSIYANNFMHFNKFAKYSEKHAALPFVLVQEFEASRFLEMSSTTWHICYFFYFRSTISENFQMECIKIAMTFSSKKNLIISLYRIFKRPIFSAKNISFHSLIHIISF